MGYTNSPLVVYTKISPNRSSPRNHAIDRITIHHMAWVNATVEACGNSFAKSSRQASSNYGIGNDGRVGLYVEEKDRAWTSSSAANDNRAVTIEVANNAGAPNWTISTKAYNALIDLVTDICKRNGKNKIIWFGDKNKTLNYSPKSNEMVMTVHRWFASTACPGEYLYGKHADIAKAVNERLSDTSVETKEEETSVQEDTSAVAIETATDNETIIWNFLRSKGLNEYATAGLMGNLKAESNLRPNNLQNTYENKFNLSDEEYTKRVDNGTYSNFVHDSAGYGLAQWTYYSRKQNLLAYANSTGKSIGDLNMQLEFLWIEIQRYTDVMKTLKNATSVYAASTAVLTGYEKPANQDSSVKTYRSNLGTEIYNRHKSSPVTSTTSTATTATTTTTSTKTYTVQVGAFSKSANANKRVELLKKKGITASVVKVGSLYKVRVKCASKSDAQKMISKIKGYGINAVLV